ncbi:MAG: hypothetical protein JXB48_12595 [Candidatus Latescibacteria bacterium]|nr:hypothetical protein [Candidatus Latescibacterota bacterium]
MSTGYKYLATEKLRFRFIARLKCLFNVSKNAPELTNMVVIVFFISINLFWVLTAEIIPFQDLPNHLASVRILLESDHNQLFQEYFSISDYLLKPYIVHAILLYLFSFVGLDAAVKIIVSLIMISLPASLFFFLYKIDKNSTYLSTVCLPLLWNKLLVKGNLGFLLGIALAFFTLAVVWDIVINGKKNLKNHLFAAILSSFVFLTHLVAFFLMFLSIIILIISASAYLKKRCVTVFISFIPSIVLCGCLFLFSPIQSKATGNMHFSITENLNISNLFDIFSSSEIQMYLPLLGWMIVLCIIGVKKWKTHLPQIYMVSGILLIYLLLPTRMGDLVRPYERSFFFLLFIIPVLFTNINIRYFKLLTFYVCCISALFVDHYYISYLNKLIPPLCETRAMLAKLQNGKKLLPIFVNEPYIGETSVVMHLPSYYTVDSRGYVPTVFGTDYSLVNKKENDDIQSFTLEQLLELVDSYDYLFLFGTNAMVLKNLHRKNFYMVGRSENIRIYANSSHPL